MGGSGSCTSKSVPEHLFKFAVIKAQKDSPSHHDLRCLKIPDAFTDCNYSSTASPPVVLTLDPADKSFILHNCQRTLNTQGRERSLSSVKDPGDANNSYQHHYKQPDNQDGEQFIDLCVYATILARPASTGSYVIGQPGKTETVERFDKCFLQGRNLQEPLGCNRSPGSPLLE
jgi:hypothetical protein